MKSFTFPVRVRFAETDAMGIVHHAHYFEYFEAARIGMLEAMGLPYVKIIEMGYHLPLIEASATYRQPAKFDDRLEIAPTLQPLEGPKLTITYQVRRGADVIAEGATTHVFIDTAGKAVRPPKEFLAIL